MREKIRVSYGSAVELGLLNGKLATSPKTAYLLLGDGSCRGVCAFCPQSTKGPHGQIARVDWPQFPLESVLEAVASSKSIERVCMQCQDEPGVMEGLPRLVALASALKPVSVSLPPWSGGLMMDLKVAGAERLTIPIDCASQKLFREVKGRSMSAYIDALGSAVGIFGKGRVGTHIIVGLGEREDEVVALAARLRDMGVATSLFAFTPVKGTRMEGEKPPSIAVYRRIQLALYAIEAGSDGGSFTFDRRGRIVGFPTEKGDFLAMMSGGKPFETKGCPGCNRPYFNERVSGPLFNYPRPLSGAELRRIGEEISADH